jgi:oligopeptide/dipeptide ABC transporter ATP-binding protein
LDKIMSHLLSVKNLTTSFQTREGRITAVDNVSFDLKDGEVLGIVGESGSGKSITSLSIMRLIPAPAGRIDRGIIQFEADDLLSLKESAMLKIRGNRISMIFQEPMTSLNPVFTIGNQMIESLRLHKNISRQDAREEALQLLSLVGISAPEQRLKEYSHQLSGGMRQRVMIAMAISCKPQLLIADEPTTALDVTIQAQILELLLQLKSEYGMSVILITHDLSVIAETAKRVIVMYAGQIVEEASVVDLFKKPLHPYTKGLLASIPTIEEEREELYVIPGNIPKPTEVFTGCRFYDRCELANSQCKSKTPDLQIMSDERKIRCLLVDEY